MFMLNKISESESESERIVCNIMICYLIFTCDQNSHFILPIQ